MMLYPALHVAVGLSQKRALIFGRINQDQGCPDNALET